MSTLLRLQHACLSYGDIPLLTDANCEIKTKQRIAILGRNGAGKSTLMQVLQGHTALDDGICYRAPNIHTTALAQEIPEKINGTIYDLVAQTATSNTPIATHQVESIIHILKLNPSQSLSNLSGGTLRRALLAKALVQQPDVLFLDEPTNHLDLASILWLETFLQKLHTTLVLVTHDRAFMQSIATHIFELDRGKLLCWQGDYHSFLQHKQQLLQDEERSNALFDKRLAEEERWIRQGIKARRTRNEGRVRALKKMRSERSERIEQQGDISIEQQGLKQGSQQLFSINNLTLYAKDQQDHAKQDPLAANNNVLVEHFSIDVMRGSKIGIIGKNGCGKSSLIRRLIASQQQHDPHIKAAKKLHISYLDQHRHQLNPDMSVLDNLSQDSSNLTINGRPVHAISYLKKFLFSPEKSRSLVRTLSGGERNRLLLARILAQPADLLILDEPSNDLDIQSIEILEQFLQDYQGSILLVSHDRALLNRVAHSIWSFEQDKHLTVYAGNYDDYLLQYQHAQNSQPQQANIADKKSPTKKPQAKRREVEKLLKKIDQTEKKIDALHQLMAANDYSKQDPSTTQQQQQQLQQLETQLQNYYQDWEQIEDHLSSS